VGSCVLSLLAVDRGLIEQHNEGDAHAKEEDDERDSPGEEVRCHRR
jgi:hypothetical protein